MCRLVCVDFFLHDQYALYEQVWKRHPLCTLLNMFSYASFLVSIFLSLLVSYMRMIACVYPFKLGSVSASGPVCAILIFLCVSFAVSYIPYSGIIGLYIDEPQMTLGFGLILPVMMHGYYVWSLAAYAIPVAIMICGSAAFQLACIHTLTRRPKSLNQCSKTLPHRQRSVVRCLITLILPLCYQIPLLLLHVAGMFGIEFSPQVALGTSVSTLLVYSLGSAVLYVAITPTFISFICARESPN